MRVVIATESFHPQVNGVARSVERVASHLRHRGHEPLVVAPGPGPDEVDGVPVVRLPAVRLPFCRAFPVGMPVPRLRAAIEAHDPHVVHLASPIAVGARAAVVACQLDLPTVAVFQTDVAGFATQYGMSVLAPSLWRWTARVHRDVTRTLAPSRGTARDLRAHGIERVHRWGRGVDADQFDPARRTRPVDPAVVRVGYVGRLAAEKRVERLAHARMPGVELVVVGDGDRRAALERQLPDATFTGTLRGDALGAVYADLDVFVHTGTHETFCQAVQEALAAGVPVVAPAAGGPLDLVRHGENGFLWRPDRPEDIAPLVARLVGDPALRRRMGSVARDGVRSRSWERLGDELVGHLTAAVHEHRPHDVDERGVA